MDASFLWLCEISFGMFLGSIIAGIVPLRLTIAETKMRRFTILGAGLLIGTAFTVIIPEGIEMLYNGRVDYEKTNESEKLQKAWYEFKTKAENISHKIKNDNCEENRTPLINAKLGFSLLFGFIFMLLVDQQSTFTKKEERRGTRSKQRISTTIGLTIHSVIDGIAMGTAAFSNQESLKYIVFFAIMLHKMPAAFGFVTFLVASRISARRITKYLTIFSLAAPIGALGTYWLMSWMLLITSQATIACLMLFSAGTFLYVATIHVFPELDKSRDDTSTESEAMIVDVQHLQTGHSHAPGPILSKNDLLFLFLGSVLPGLLMIMIH